MTRNFIYIGYEGFVHRTRRFKDDTCNFRRNIEVFFGNTTIKHHIKQYKDVFSDSFSIWSNRLHVGDIIHSLEDTYLAYIIHEQIKLFLIEDI